MKTMTKRIVAVLLALMTVCAMIGFSSCSSKKENTIVIGVSGPLTGSNAMYGIGVQNAAQMAIDEINAKGGLFDTVKLELVSVDDMADPAKVGSAYATMLNKKVQVALGCVTSGACAEFVNLSKDDNVFFITPSASNDDVPKEKNGYQMCFADGNQGGAAAAYVNENFSGKTIGVLYCSGDNYSEGIYNQFKEKLDSSVTAKIASFTKDATDFSSQVELLKDCEFVFLPIYYTPASLFMLESLKHPNNMKVFYGCDGLDGIDAIEGFDISTIPQEISYLSHFNASSDDEVTKTFVNSYENKYGETPSQFAAAAYDCVYAIVRALEKAGSDKVNASMSASELCNILTAQFDGDFTFSGVTGKNMKWTRATTGFGYVEKSATKFVVKEATAK